MRPRVGRQMAQAAAIPRPRKVATPIERRWERLENLVLQTELRICDAERRVERYHELWRNNCADSRQRHAHIKLEQNLLKGLKLLHKLRAMTLDEQNSPATLVQCIVRPGATSSPGKFASDHRMARWIDHSIDV